MTETIEIKNRWDGSILFSTNIEKSNRPFGSKLGIAVKVAFEKGADLGDADLYGADLYGADLRGANLYGADLYGADLYGADLRGANLRDANLRGADLYGADLRGAYLRGAYLYGANLRGANLRDANLRGADLGDKTLIGRHTRNDDYEYLAFALDDGGLLIQAGCREWEGNDALERAREHCRTKTDKAYRAQALRICDYIEADWKAHLEQQAEKAA